MVGLPFGQRQQDAHRATADQEQFVAGIAACEDLFACRHMARFETQFQRLQGMFLAMAE